MVAHSNAEEERLFSIRRKNKNCIRSNLDPNETLGSLAKETFEMNPA